MPQRTFSRDAIHPLFQIRNLDTIDTGHSIQTGIPQRLSQYEFLWIQKGRGVLVVDFQDYTLSGNEIYCLSPGQCRMMKETKDLRGYYIGVSKELYARMKGEMDFLFLDLLTGRGKILCLTPGMEQVNELNAILQLMRKEYDANTLSRMDLLTGFLRIFMLYLSKGASPGSQGHKWNEETEKVIKYLQLVNDNFMDKKMVSDYARELALTPATLNYIVKKISGNSARYHIQQCIILEAKRQIIFDKARMKDLAYTFGFRDCAHFSRYFKNNSGMNYSSFRNDLINY